MQDDNTEVDQVANGAESGSDQPREVDQNNSGSDLNETDKLHISSDFVNEDDDDDDDILPSIRPKQKKKAFNIMDSDSENDEEHKQFAEEENEDEEGDGSDDERNVNKSPFQGDAAKSDNEIDDDSDEPEESRKDIPAAKQSPVPKYKSLIDSDTESEPEQEEVVEDEQVESDQEDENEDEPQEEKPPTKKNELPKRMSAKQAMEQMKAIKSESQRLSRESYITIPYHEPKQYSLKEFMNRKTIAKPNSRESQKQFSLKMSQEELEEFARQLKEREEEAARFFKSNDKKNKTLIKEELKEEEEDTEMQVSEPKTQITHQVNEEESMEVESLAQTDKLAQEKPTNVSQNKVESSVLDEETELVEAPISEPQQSKVFDSEVDELFTPGTLESVTIPETEENAPEIETEKTEIDSVKLSDTEQSAPLKLSITESIHEVLKERNVVESPVLKGSPNMVIDLETGDVVPLRPSGVDQLFQRFLKHSAKKKTKEFTNMSIVSTENGTLEITNVNIAVNEEENKEQKPGAAYTKLKDNLMKVIMKRRKEEFQKKIQQNQGQDKENGKEGYEEEMEELKEEPYLDEEEEEIFDEDENELDEGEDEVDNKEKPDNVTDDEHEEDEIQNSEADDEYESGEEENDDDSDDDELPEPKPFKTRIISNFDDSDDEIEKKESLNINTASQKTDRLWNEETKNNSVEEDDLLELCSGRFDATQKNSVISQIPTTQPEDGVDESELLALCSGTFHGTQSQVHDADQNQSEAIPVPKRLESSDEEAEEDTELKAQVKQKKVRKLGFSDDEEENEQIDLKDDEDPVDDLNQEDLEEEKEEPIQESEVEDLPETYIDYDSEENEIEVAMTKKDRQERATEFFEKEAELSESEWGSADEDEKGMDRYDMELADEEEFDKDKLQTELGKIHMRRVLDDDIREVKKLQEMFFEDEENDGVGRQRQFKWKNLTGGFELDTDAGGEVDGTQENDDEGDEALWRKMRFEREVLLQEQAEKLGTPNSTLKPAVTTSIGKKLTIVDVNSPVTAATEKSSPFLIAKGMISNRGSFLMRDNDTLSKLANITKSGGEQETGAIQVRTGKAKNFVFASISSTEKENSMKRKMVISEQEPETNYKKKLKTNIKSKIRLIDHLA